jgi:hypothetical protein
MSFVLRKRLSDRAFRRAERPGDGKREAEPEGQT